jgi:hypothetical protein
MGSRAAGRVSARDASSRGRWGIALQLGRVSNLPTAWSNGLAGAALAGGSVLQPAMALVLVAISMAYIGGMYLNDAFDRHIDAMERPGRPIPSNRISANAVFGIGFALLLASIGATALAAMLAGTDATSSVLSAVALAGVILLYDIWHKGNPASPVLMGACRSLAYVTAALALSGATPPAVLAAAAVTFSYLIGLTYLAKQETLGHVQNLWPLVCLAAPIPYVLAFGGGGLALLLLVALGCCVCFALFLVRRRRPGDVPRAVVCLIAGIALLDALFLAVAGHLPEAGAAVLCFGATLLLQRWISGT